MATNKIIPQLPEITSPDLNGYVVYDDTITTYKLNLDNLLNLIRSELPSYYLVNVTFSDDNLILTFTNGSVVNVPINEFINLNVIS